MKEMTLSQMEVIEGGSFWTGCAEGAMVIWDSGAFEYAEAVAPEGGGVAALIGGCLIGGILG